MIKLQNIHRDKGSIICDAFVEDCTKPVSLSLNEQTKELGEFTLPNNYEYCKSHIMHAKKYLKSLIGKEFKNHEKMIMWY